MNAAPDPAVDPSADPATALAREPGGRPRVAVVFGGRSGEHAISCMTAASVLRALDRAAYDVVPIGITRSGRWVLAPDEPSRYELTDGRLPEVTADEGPRVLVPLESGDRALTVLEPGQVPRVLGEVDVVFPLLHGPFGEDGTLQGLLELADVRYVGSGVLASAAGMDKHVMKLLLAAQGIPVGDHLLVTARHWERDPESVRADVEELGYPVYVKPSRAGSSLGIARVKGPADLDAAVEQARRHDPRILVETEIEGREVECSVLESIDGGAPATSLPGEIEVGSAYEFYDFEAKYLSGEAVRLVCPADLPDDVVHRVRDLAARTFEALGCEGLARVDFFVEGETVLLNEINTMPGFTPISMYPRMWAATGLDYPTLVDRLVQLALRRRTGLR
jgi:D-alanine-D-alanine ligase